MVKTTLGVEDKTECKLIASMLQKSQTYVRECEGDPSVVSLRDVQRCLNLLVWFLEKLGGERSNAPVRNTCKIVILLFSYDKYSSAERKEDFCVSASSSYCVILSTCILLSTAVSHCEILLLGLRIF